MGKAGLPKTPIKFRELWDCCWGNETHVITFDCGARHAVCTKCANEYTRLNGPNWAADLLADCASPEIEIVGIPASNDTAGGEGYLGRADQAHLWLAVGTYIGCDDKSPELDLAVLVVGANRSYAVLAEIGTGSLA